MTTLDSTSGWIDWICGRFRWMRGHEYAQTSDGGDAWTARPLVMGIVNVTPDSFSDGGQFATAKAAIAHGRALAAAGADILDIGGESTRPGATPPSVDEELRRVLPVVEALAAHGHCVSIDTRRPEVMRRALEAGAAIVNDVFALRAPGALDVVVASDCGIVHMHMQGTPETMQIDPQYPEGVVTEVRTFLAERLAACIDAGIDPARIALDPGFGFGKTPEHNAELTRGLPAIATLGRPILAGWSRKRSLDRYTGIAKAPADRLSESIAAALACVAHGATILRVHDVAETVAAVKVWQALGPRGRAQRA